MRATDERIAAMLQGRRNIRRLPMPGMDLRAEDTPETGVRILLDQEIDDARGDAVQYVHSKAKALRLDPDALLMAAPEMLNV